MRKVLLFSLLLLVGLAGSQLLPTRLGAGYAAVGDAVRLLTMVGLSFIMIRVGYEFDLDKSDLRRYGWDYVVAFTAASFPWVFVTGYFLLVLLPQGSFGSMAAWQETLLAGRFAAPTSAGVLFSMLAAAGLGATWLFRKARTLAIFDDLDTVLLMIPLKMLMVGVAWQLGVIVVVMAVMLAVAYLFLHRVRLPGSWPWVLAYAALIAAGSEAVYKGSKLIDESVPIHIEVLLPAFVLGCVMAYPQRRGKGGSGHADNSAHAHGHPELETPVERRVTTLVAAAFMVLVGLSMPALNGASAGDHAGHASATASLHSAGSPEAEAGAAELGRAEGVGRVTAAQPALPWGSVALHVLLVTLLANLGKMFPAFCYRREADWRERLALAIGMWPRGEVGAGVLVISLSYGIGGPVVTVAMLSLALNLLLTGFFILAVRRLTRNVPGYGSAA